MTIQHLISYQIEIFTGSDYTSFIFKPNKNNVYILHKNFDSSLIYAEGEYDYRVYINSIVVKSKDFLERVYK